MNSQRTFMLESIEDKLLETAEKMHQVCKYKIREDYDSETDSNDIGKAYKVDKKIFFFVM